MAWGTTLAERPNSRRAWGESGREEAREEACGREGRRLSPVVVRRQGDARLRAEAEGERAPLAP